VVSSILQMKAFQLFCCKSAATIRANVIDSGTVGVLLVDLSPAEELVWTNERAALEDSDQELITAAKANTAAFALLYDRYFDRIYNYSYHRTGNRQLAEDITADTFRSAIENLQRYEWRGVSFGAWLYRIASNTVAMHYRKHAHQESIEYKDIPASDAESPETVVELRDRVAQLRKALVRLTPAQQQAVTLRFGEKLKAAEMAEIMNKSEGAVKLLLHRAIRAMQRSLSEETA
jgi:RNA polymerase sigma-70 factor, ECF subfamily